MPRYLVERSFPAQLNIPMDAGGRATVESVVKNNSTKNVSWVHSYVTGDNGKTFCIYDGPNPEAIREVAELNTLPVDSITEVRVLDPYFYQP
jgi:hypothetical protein